MKQAITLKQEIKIKRQFNPTKQAQLSILELNNVALNQFLYDKIQENPYLQYTENTLDPFSFSSTIPSLSDQIFHELSLMDVDISKDLVFYLLSRLDSNGYFCVNLDTLIQESFFTKPEILRTLAILQRMDPVGCFCFSLKESLQIQCIESECAASETGLLLCDYLEEVASRDLDKLQLMTGLEKDEVEEGIDFIRTLNPKPASNYASSSQNLHPEVKVEVKEEQLFVSLLKEDFTIELNEEADADVFFKKEALVLLDALKRRKATLLAIMQVVCTIQKDFFLGQSLKRCTLQEVADALQIHVSTVSRAISLKSFEFNNRYYPIKFLFMHDGKDIQQRICSLIEAEDERHPLSDEKIRKLLLKEDIQISRRTVTKYREACHIPNTSKRRKRGEENEGKDSAGSSG